MKGEIIKEALLKISKGENLSRSEARSAFMEIMDGACDGEILAAFLTVLKMKGECVDEIVGAAQAMRSNAVFINAGASLAIDTCGTGGDGMDTFNVSTVSSFIAAGAGVCIAKHGNRAASGKCGSADLLEALGFNLDVHPSIMEHCLQENNIAFLFAPKMHPAMRFVGGLRKKLGFRTIFNLLGPLVNPAGAKAQVVGVFSAQYVEILAECLRELSCKRAFVVHANDGLDEISPSSNTRICELKNGTFKNYEFSPEMRIGRLGDFSELKGGDANRNAKICIDILSGKLCTAALDICLLNAAAAILVSGKCDTFNSAFSAATESVNSGAALAKLKTLIEFSRQ